MDDHLAELMSQCATATPLCRLSTVEQEAVFAWLLDGHMTRTGKPLERPRQPPRVIARTNDGQPIYAADADHSPTETVTIPKVS